MIGYEHAPAGPEPSFARKRACLRARNTANFGNFRGLRA
jgi:hypothetical protein